MQNSSNDFTLTMYIHMNDVVIAIMARGKQGLWGGGGGGLGHSNNKPDFMLN